MVRSTFRSARPLASRFLCSAVVCVATIVFVLLGGSTAHAQVVHLKGNRANGSGAVIGIDSHKEGVKKHYLILTAYHVMKDNIVTIDGNPVTLIAKDENTDLALAKVPLPDSAGYFLATKAIPSTGKAVLYGYPGSEYSTQDCTVDEKGDLSCKVRAGGSGGPLIKGHYFVVGVLTRYHGVATRDQIEALINAAGYSWLFQISKDYEHLYVSDVAPKAMGDDSDRQLEEYFRRIREELAREQQEHQEWRDRFFAEQDRWYREHVKKMQQQRE